MPDIHSEQGLPADACSPTGPVLRSIMNLPGPAPPPSLPLGQGSGLSYPGGVFAEVRSKFHPHFMPWDTAMQSSLSA